MNKRILLVVVWGVVIITGTLALLGIAWGAESLAVFGRVHSLAVRFGLAYTALHICRRWWKIAMAIVIHIVLHVISVHLAVAHTVFHVVQHRRDISALFKRLSLKIGKVMLCESHRKEPCY